MLISKIVPIIVSSLSLLFLASSPISYLPQYYSIQARPLPPLSLYHYKARTVWEMAEAVEYQYMLPTDLLSALIMVESEGRCTCCHKNRDGSIDRGPVQLNSRYLNWFSERYNGRKPIDPYSFDSVRIAGMFLADLKKHRTTWTDALQHYNPGKKGYADSILIAYAKLKGLD